MTLTAGTKLGPYEITGAIGAGGMGEVYRARDAKLGRDVAIKVLPEAFAGNAERMARFQREAKVLASLDHPNIASIYGLEDSGGTRALVMQLVEGPTLADRIKQGPIPVKLCELSPFVVQVLQATNLLSVFHPYASEKDAIEAFSARPQAPEERSRASSTRVICLDTSLDLLAYLKVLLQRSGYEVFTTQYPSDAVAFAMGARSSLVICGPGMRTNETVIEKFRQGAPHARVLHLPSDFSTSEADQAGPDLVNRVRSLLAPNGA